MISMKSSPAYAGELFAARRERRRQSLQHRGKPKACWPRASAQRPQHHAVHHAGQCAVDDHRAGNDEHFGRHAGDKALCLCQDRDEGNYCPILLGFWLLKFLKNRLFSQNCCDNRDNCCDNRDLGRQEHPCSRAIWGHLC